MEIVPLSTADAIGLCACPSWTSVAGGGAETNSSIAGGREVDPTGERENLKFTQVKKKMAELTVLAQPRPFFN